MNPFENSESYGGESEFAPSAEATVEQPVVQADSTAGAEQVEPSVQPATDVQGEAVQDGEAPASTETEEVELSDEDKAKLDEEVDKALADEKTPAYFKNAINVYKRSTAKLDEQLGSYVQYGKPEEIQTQLELLKGLETIRTNQETGIPERSTEPFVKGIYEKDPKIAYQLLNDLAELPSPYTPGWSVLQEMYKQTGIDPTRLNEIKTFAANGYQLQASQYPAPDAEDLSQIPDHLKPTFSALSPERRASLMLDEEGVRDANLEDARIAMESKTREASQKETQEAEAKQKEQQEQIAFKNAVQSKGYENFETSGDTVLTSFVDSLATQAKMSKMDSVMIAQTVMNSFENTAGGRLALETLKAEGITIDPAIPTTITELRENANHIAYFELTGDEAGKAKAVAKQVELQERLVGKGNKIIAALALKRAGSVAQPVNQLNSSLAQTQNQNRYAATGTGAQVNSNGNPKFDYSDEGYAELLRAQGFGADRR